MARRKRNPNYPHHKLSADQIARMQSTGREMKKDCPRPLEVFMAWYLRPMKEGAACAYIEVIGEKFFKHYKVHDVDKAEADKIASELHQAHYGRKH